MKEMTRRRNGNMQMLANAWLAFGGLLALGVVVLAVREIPALRREARILRM